MNKYKCNGCGKIHATKPEKCDCDTNDQGFTEVIVEIQKEAVDLEKIKADLLAEEQAKLDAKLEAERAKLKKDAEESEAEKIKALREQILKENEEDAKLSDEQKKLKEMEKKLNSVLELNNQYKETVDTLANEREENSRKLKRLALKDEIVDRSKEKPWMVDLAKVEFEAGRINSVEEYDVLVDSFYGKQAKEAFDLKEQSKTWGQDPANNYKQNRTSAKEAKTEISEKNKAVADKYLNKAGIRV